MVIDIDGQTVNLMTAVSLVMLAAFTAYAVDIIKKLKDMLTTTTPGTNNNTTPPEVNDRIEEDNQDDTSEQSN